MITVNMVIILIIILQSQPICPKNQVINIIIIIMIMIFMVAMMTTMKSLPAECRSTRTPLEQVAPHLLRT